MIYFVGYRKFSYSMRCMVSTAKGFDKLENARAFARSVGGTIYYGDKIIPISEN